MNQTAPSQSRYPFHVFANGWFRVAFSDDLQPGELKPLRYFGKELVLFRLEGGSAHLFDAHCPHMGAHLGYGAVVTGEALRCPFHHWEFDGAGKCSKIPYAKRIPPKAEIGTYPLVEKNGGILMWHDRDGRAPSFEVPEIREIGDPAWSRPEIAHWELRANWLDMNENCVDQAHFKFVHGTLSIPPTEATVEGHIHRTESQFRMRIPGGEGDATLVTTDHGPGFQIVRISGLIDTILMNTATPIDEERTDVRFCYTVKTEGETRKTHLAEAVIKDLKQQFENDIDIWENKAYFEKPVLCEGDGPLPHYRKWYSQFV
jgi:phenylpropionate dioxygenase-like ring-hydroxylating dioxygenase large terminal subunit